MSELAQVKRAVGNHHRLYYDQHKDKKADYYIRNSDTKASYCREYNLQNREKIAVSKASYNFEYRNRTDGAVEFRMQSSIRNKDKTSEKSGAMKQEKNTKLRRYSNQERNAEYDIRKSASRADYLRQYNLRNRQKNAASKARINLDFRNGNNLSGAEYYREYYLQNRDKKAEYNQISYSKAEYRQLHNLQEKDADRSNGLRTGYYRRSYLRNYERMNSASKLAYNQQYYQQYKDRSAAFRNDVLRSEYQLEYSRGRKEFAKLYSRLYHGHQKTNQSWKTPDLAREYFESIAERFNISSFVDWYRISRKQLDQHQGLSLYSKFGSLGAALQFAYPEIKWDLSVFGNRAKKSGQRWLKIKVKQLLPRIEIIEDYQHPDLKWDELSERNMELDLWIPAHRIGIEYQGEQHFWSVDSFGPSNGTGSYWERDSRKNNLCSSRGITLVTIPYCLLATLYLARPDVFPVSNAAPIPREMPFRIGASANANQLARANPHLCTSE